MNPPPDHLTVAQRASAFLQEGRRDVRKGRSPGRVHAICNAYLKSLRSGSRRHSYSGLRGSLRALRASAAEKMKATS